MKKYIILDFGKVLAYPTTGNWDITPKFLKLIDINKIDINKLKEIRKKYSPILSEKVVTLEEEYDMYKRFYDGILKDYKLENYKTEIAEQIAYDRTYNHNKYTLYPNIEEELKVLKENYTLILLSDNWPSVLPYMKDNNIYNYFDKIYISSIYGQEKKDGLFFDNPIKDFNIKKGEAIFIDDNESLLDIAITKGLDVRLMNREKNINSSKYKIISNLYEINELKS